jgi:hypothetical protein
MAVGRDFYLTRATEARACAEASMLDNVRDRWLRSAANWSAMAARSARSEKMHAQLIAEKEEERAASGRRKPGLTRFDGT